MLTIKELHALRKRYLAEMKDDLEGIRTVARMLGEPSPIPLWVMWTRHSWSSGLVSVELCEGTTDWLPDQESYNKVSKLTVNYGGRRVCYVREDRTGYEDPDNFVTPGDWAETILTHYDKAASLIEGSQKSEEDLERERLAQLLGVREVA